MVKFRGALREAIKKARTGKEQKEAIHREQEIQHIKKEQAKLKELITLQRQRLKFEKKKEKLKILKGRTPTLRKRTIKSAFRLLGALEKERKKHIRITLGANPRRSRKKLKRVV